jgi:hypothetical protein
MNSLQFDNPFGGGFAMTAPVNLWVGATTSRRGDGTSSEENVLAKFSRERVENVARRLYEAIMEELKELGFGED